LTIVFEELAAITFIIEKEEKCGKGGTDTGNMGGREFRVRDQNIIIEMSVPVISNLCIRF
jgi:hypothetical protein